MLNIYLNTVESQFLNTDGNLFPERSPELSVGGREEVRFFLKKETPEWGTAGADPTAWLADTSWGNIPGIAAMVTVDNDYRKYAKGTLTATVASGSRSVAATIANADDIPHKGVLRLYQADGSYDSVAFSSREINGAAVTFALDTAVTKSYEQGGILDCTTAPLAQAYLDAAKSHWGTGELVFDLVLDSERLRSENDYSDQETVAIKGLELLLYTVNDGTVQILKSFLLDTAILRNVQGNPGFNAPVPDPFADHIAAEVDRQLEGVASRVVPSIAANGNWVVDGQDTGKSSQGKQGEQGEQGERGPKGDKGDNGILENLSIEITSATDGIISLQGDKIFPVALYTFAGNCYPIEKESIVKTTTGWNIAIAKYLAYDNTSSFIPPWNVYCAGGVKGESGTNFLPDARGTEADRSSYDAEHKGFAFLNMENNCLYYKLSDNLGEWSQPHPMKGEKGDKGEDGTVLVYEGSAAPENPSVGTIWISTD